MRQLFRTLRASVFLLARKKQFRFEISEPRRHHEIIGCNLKLELLCFGNKFEILLNERQDGDFCQINFLSARQRQQ